MTHKMTELVTVKPHIVAIEFELDGDWYPLDVEVPEGTSIGELDDLVELIWWVEVEEIGSKYWRYAEEYLEVLERLFPRDAEAPKPHRSILDTRECKMSPITVTRIQYVTIEPQNVCWYWRAGDCLRVSCKTLEHFGSLGEVVWEHVRCRVIAVRPVATNTTITFVDDHGRTWVVDADDVEIEAEYVTYLAG